MEGCRPTGSSIERGGDTNGPAAVYAVTKYVEWLRKYAPPEAAGMTFSESGRCRRRATSRSRCSGTPPSPPTW
jgi:hypothetical protein